MIDHDRIVRRLLDLRSLSVFAAVREDPVIRALRLLLEALAGFGGSGGESGGIEAARSSALSLAQTWAAFAGAFAAQGGSIRALVAAAAAVDENPFTLAAERETAATLSLALAAAARADFARLERLAGIEAQAVGEDVAAILRSAGFEDAASDAAAEGAAFSDAAGSAARARREGGDPAHPAAAVLLAASDWPAALGAFVQAIRSSGAGLLGAHRSFVWTAGDGGARVSASLRPVRHPDPIRLGDLSGYEDQRNVVIDNTLRFLEGKSANNMLLYGDRGTGKSATVKAVCGEYAGRGLRLIEVRKSELAQFADILEGLADRAARFVVFVDDLTFEKTDDAYTGLKALLEGGAEARPDNVVVYATSNRRHLVKEKLSDRPTTAAAALAAETGDVRAFDSMQEQLSLADRFGVTVVFSAPSQDEYLRIAEFIAEGRGILQPPGAGGKRTPKKEAERERFRADALRWERWFNGRSPRTARQYVDWLEGGEGFPWE